MNAKASINLDDLSVTDLSNLIREAEAKRLSKRDDAKAALIAETTEKAAALGFTVQELFSGAQASSSSSGRKKRSDAGAIMTPKFRGPNGEEWSGRGRTPVWMREAEAAGKSRDTFRI